MQAETSRAIPLYLTWLGTLCGTLLLLLSDVLPCRLSFVRPETLFVCLTEVEVAFALFAWPVFIPSMVAPGAAPRRAGLRLLAEVAVLLVAAFPPELLAANVSNVGLGVFLRAQAVVAGIAGFAAAYGVRTGRDRRCAGPGYVLAALVLSAFLPFVHFILPGAGLSWLSALSPFWAAARVDGTPPLILAAVLAVGAAVLFGVPTGAGKAPAA